MVQLIIMSHLSESQHNQVDNRTGEKLIFRRSGMALPPVLGQDTDSDAGEESCLVLNI